MFGDLPLLISLKIGMVGTSRLRASTEHILIVRGLRAKGSSRSSLLHPCHSLSRFNGIVEQHRNRHRTDSTGNRADPAGLLADRLEIHIPDHLAVRETIRAHVDH